MPPRKISGQTTQYEKLNYLHLSLDGRAFDYCKDGRYREVEISLALMAEVLAPDRLRPCHG